jgi:SAM-dependent methyltransferase
MFRKPLAALKLKPEEFDFVDYGSGKGRVLMFAALAGFKSVTGVEISARLSAIGRANLDRFAAPNPNLPPLRIVEGDAASFVPVGKQVLAYFYNPFDHIVFEEVRRQLERCLVCGTERLVVIYANPEHASVFEKAEGWVPGPTTPGASTFIAIAPEGLRDEVDHPSRAADNRRVLASGANQ